MKEAALRLDLVRQFDCLPDRLLLKSIALVGAGVSLDVSAIGTGSQIKLKTATRYKLLYALSASKLYIFFSNFVSVFPAVFIYKVLLFNYQFPLTD
ncbi:hypothetical protein C7B69_12360 [filamentous cyanobacterium Phorm 46]|nr:hypothetical protein C7B69_12360 [filamentous cyanobacterium Phorm 46]PSB52429.1 hypothetical protein C7B67_07085 [filamentous cyanobacterium Phorm 6]